jgi:hypothetical protein
MAALSAMHTQSMMRVQEFLDESLVIAERMYERQPLDKNVIDLLASTKGIHAAWYLQRGNIQKGHDEFSEIVALITQAIIYQPEAKTLEFRLCEAELQIAEIHNRNNDVNSAFDFYEKVLTRLQSLGPGPGIAKGYYLLIIENAFKRSFGVFVETGNQEIYISFADAYLKKLFGTDRLGITIFRAMMVANQGKHVDAAAAVRTAVAGRLLFRPSGYHHHYAAMALAECSRVVLEDTSLQKTEREALSSKYEKEAVVNIKTADQKGAYKDQQLHNELLTMPALKKVREHPEIKAILKKLPPVPMPPKK